METYRVVSITDKKGNPRIEGRYPLRVELDEIIESF